MGAQENQPPGDDARAVLDAMRRIVRDLRVSSRLAERTAGLTAAQLFVLEKLEEQGGTARGRNGPEGISLNELAERTLTHQSSVSVVVQRLVARGLVRRKTSAADARRVELSLTPAGRTVLRNAPEVTQHRLVQALQAMTRAERRDLSALMETLVKRMGIADEPVEMMEDDGPPSQPPRRRERAVRGVRGR